MEELTIAINKLASAVTGCGFILVFILLVFLFKDMSGSYELNKIQEELQRIRCLYEKRK